MREIPKNAMWVGIVLMLATGLVHLVSAAQELAEAPSLSLLFIMNFIAAVLAAIGIYRGALLWGWGLGLLVTAGAFVGYVISRSVGLPGMEPEAWLQPLGMLSLVVELTFIALFVWTRWPLRTAAGSH